MKLQVIITNDFLKLIDDFCEKFGYNRSEFIRNCIRSEIFSQTNEALGVSRETTSPVVSELFKKVEPIITPGTVAGMIKNPKGLQKNLALIPGMCKHGAAFGNCKHGCRPGREK